MSTGLKANADGSAAIQVGGSDAISITSGLAATFPSNVSVTGNVSLTGATSTLGYGTGSGGAVTQLTSRTTAVTLNKSTGAITMFTAAGTATWQTFTVNNSLVANTDNIVINIAGGDSNIYGIHVRDVNSGSFGIAFAALSGTASDAPRINFAVIKGVTS